MTYPRLIAASALAVFFITVGLVYRLFFLYAFGGDDPIPGGVQDTLFLGLRFDLRFSLLIVIPFLFLSRLSKLDPFSSTPATFFWVAHFSVLFSVVLFFYAADFAYYDYLQERLDASSVRFFENPLISMEMLWQSYPIVPSMLVIAGVVWVFAKSLRRLLVRLAGRRPSTGMKQKFAVVTMATVVVLGGIYGKWSYYPLRWSDGYVSSAEITSQISLNPVLYFIDTFSTAETNDGDTKRLQQNYTELAEYLRVEEPNIDRLDFRRTIVPTPLADNRPNVVVIMMESFAAHLTGFHGNPLQASPAFDGIAEDGLVFTRYYSPRVGTAFGIYAMFTGIADVSINRTASRNPKAVDQDLILNQFDGYEKYYFIGGSANWANIRALLKRNIDGLRLYEEGDFSDVPRTDVWGISDLHLLEEANRVLKKQNEPFFAFVQLSGNHRPYTIPNDSRGFEYESIDNDIAVRNGFDGEAGYNSFRFMDYSLDTFMRQAAAEPYFQNTLFVLTADNGEIGRVPGPLNREESSRISNNHAPLVIAGEALNRKSQTIECVASQMDLMPTLAGAVGIPALNRTLGNNLLDGDCKSNRAFIQRRFGKNVELVVVDSDYVLLRRPNADRSMLIRYQPELSRWIDAGDQPQILDSMTRFAEGFYDASKLMMLGENL